MCLIAIAMMPELLPIGSSRAADVLPMHRMRRVGTIGAFCCSSPARARPVTEPASARARKAGARPASGEMRVSCRPDGRDLRARLLGHHRAIPIMPPSCFDLLPIRSWARRSRPRTQPRRRLSLRGWSSSRCASWSRFIDHCLNGLSGGRRVGRLRASDPGRASAPAVKPALGCLWTWGANGERSSALRLGPRVACPRLVLSRRCLRRRAVR